VSVSGFTETESQTLTQTQILPPVTVTLTTSVSTTEVSTAYVTYTAFTSKCDFCKVDLYAIGLAFPTTYVATKTVYATTTGLHTTILPDGSYVTETSVTYAPKGCSSEPLPTTWLFSGIEL
jgi:hypothetical protein